MEPTLSALKINVEPKKLLVTSEPYVIITALGYQAVVNIIESRTRREHFIYIGPKSIAKPLEQLRKENAGKTFGLEFWLRKEGDEKYSKYILEE